MDWREIEDIETHVADFRQTGNHVVKGSMPVRIATLRPREYLVPAGKRSLPTLGINRMKHGANTERTPVGEIHQPGCIGRHQDFDLAALIGCSQLLQQGRQFLLGSGRHGGGRLAHRPFDKRLPFHQLQAKVQPCLVLLSQLIAIDGKRFLPGFHVELVPTIAVERETRAPAIIFHQSHPRLAPDVFVLGAEEQRGGDKVMPIGEYVGLDSHDVTHHALDRKAPTIHGGRDLFDGNTRGSGRLRRCHLGGLRLDGRCFAGRKQPDFAGQQLGPGLVQSGQEWRGNFPQRLTGERGCAPQIPADNDEIHGSGRQRIGGIAFAHHGHRPIGINLIEGAAPLGSKRARAVLAERISPERSKAPPCRNARSPAPLP